MNRVPCRNLPLVHILKRAIPTGVSQVIISILAQKAAQRDWLSYLLIRRPLASRSQVCGHEEKASTA